MKGAVYASAIGLAMLVASIACRKSPEHRPSDSQGNTVPRPTPQAPDASVDLAITKTERLCSRIDAARLAKAIGAAKLTHSSTGETLMVGGVGPAWLGCSLRERTDSYTGFDIGLSIEAETTLEAKDHLDRFEWETYELLGQPARIGVAFDSLHLQVVVKGVRLHADLGHDTIPPLELEKRLVAATEYFIELLPVHAATLLR